MRSVPDSVKRTAGKAMAMRLTTSLIADASARSPFMNFSRAGVAKNRSRTSTVVPRLAAAGRTGGDVAALDGDLGGRVGRFAVRERMVSRDTEPIDGSASPRKPSERMSWMSFDSLEVQWRETASSSSSGGMPEPSSVTRIRFEPAAGGGDLDARRAGVERVLDQFLDHARRTLDDLAGGDLVDHRFGKLANGHRATIRGFGWGR